MLFPFYSCRVNAQSKLTGMQEDGTGIKGMAMELNTSLLPSLISCEMSRQEADREGFVPEIFLPWMHGWRTARSPEEL